MSTPLLLEVAPEIDTDPTSFYRGRGRGGRSASRPQLYARPQRSPCLSGPTYFDLAMPLFSRVDSIIEDRSS